MAVRRVVHIRRDQFRREDSPSCLVVDAGMESTGCEIRGGRGDGRNFGAKDRFSRLGLCGQLECTGNMWKVLVPQAVELAWWDLRSSALTESCQMTAGCR